MKVKDVARFSELKAKHEHGPVSSYLMPNRPNILKVIEASPGLSVPEIANAMGIKDRPSRTSISASLHQMSNAKRPKTKRIFQDGWFRYYPANYKLSTDPQPADIRVEPTAPPIPEPVDSQPQTRQIGSNLRQIAMEYIWETGEPVSTVKHFIDWAEGHKTDLPGDSK